MDGTRRNAEKLTAIRGADTNGRPPDAVPDVLRRSALPQQSAAPRPVRALRHINSSDSLVGAKFPSTSGLNWNDGMEVTYAPNTSQSLRNQVSIGILFPSSVTSAVLSQSLRNQGSIGIAGFPGTAVSVAEAGTFSDA